MPQVFDNIDKHLLPTLSEAMGLSERGDFCVGYFNLRGWRQIDAQVEKWTGGDGHCCRLLVGMQQPPQDQLRAEMRASSGDGDIDNATAIRLKRQLAQDFRDQLTYGIPTSADEAGLRRLAAQITARKLVVKLFLRHSLHAKLYLLFRQDFLNPKIGYLGSSNLTLSGLSKQGELNIDVLDHDACDKLARWFEDRWTDRFCVDISDELVEIINTSVVTTAKALGTTAQHVRWRRHFAKVQLALDDRPFRSRAGGARRGNPRRAGACLRSAAARSAYGACPTMTRRVTRYWITAASSFGL